jgi:hypothetical protein
VLSFGESTFFLVVGETAPTEKLLLGLLLRLRVLSFNLVAFYNYEISLSAMGLATAVFFYST